MRTSSWRGPTWLWLAAILAATFIVYIPSLQNGFTNWDDDGYVTTNRLLTHPDIGAILTTPVRGNFHPLTMASLALNYRLSGLAPASYHWVNLLLHLANTGLVFVFVRRLSRGRLWTSAATSLFFGIHPMHVESVAWIAERKDVLYAFFYLIGLVVYLRYLDTRRWPWLLAALVAFVFSAASKPAAIVLPATLLLLDWFRERPFRAAVLLEKAPFVIVSAVTGYVTLLAQESSGALNTQAPLVHKVLYVAYGFLMYLVKFFVPVHLSALHPYPKVPGPDFYAAFVAVLVLLPALLYLCRRSRVACFGLGFFFVNIVLVLQIVTVGEAVMAERYTYLPYVGLLFALAWWLDDRGERRGPRLAKVGVAACFLLMLPFCLAQTWNRCRVWRDSGTLWSDAIQKYPDRNFDGYYHRGLYRLQVTRRLHDAIADLNRTVATNPRLARGWLAKGEAHMELGELDSAYISLNRALSLNPRMAEAYSRRGMVELDLGSPGQAMIDLNAALRTASMKDPLRGTYYLNRSRSWSALGNRARARADAEEARRLNASDPPPGRYW